MFIYSTYKCIVAKLHTLCQYIVINNVSLHFVKYKLYKKMFEINNADFNIISILWHKPLVYMNKYFKTVMKFDLGFM